MKRVNSIVVCIAILIASTVLALPLRAAPEPNPVPESWELLLAPSIPMRIQIDLGSGPVGFAVGFEYRREFADFRPDFALSSAQAFGFNQAQPLKGGFELWELYAETIIPLLSDMPGIEMLEVSLAARFSDYTTAGTVYTYAAGVNWDVIDGFRVRAGYQRAVRAPNVGERREAPPA